MACTYGSEKKFPTDSTITIYPYEGKPQDIRVIMGYAGIPEQIDLNADEICSQEPPEYQEIDISDIFNPVSINIKVFNSAKRDAWFKGCQCKSAPTPPPPEEIPQPPELEPPNVDLPELPPFGSSGFSCEGVIRARWIWEVRGWNGEPKVGVIGAIYFEAEDVTGTPTVDVFNSSNPRVYALYVNSIPRFVSTVNDQYDWKLIYCNGENPVPPEKGEEPKIPSPCPDSAENDCLKQPDKADIISSLQLHISESNDRIRDEILLNTSQAIENALSVINTNIESARQNLNQGLDIVDQNQNGRQIELINENRRNTRVIQDDIDGIKNQILLAIAGAVTAIGAGIVAATATITTAITAATGTVTGAITTATTSINSNTNSARDKIIEDISKEIERYSPRYRILLLTFTQVPQGISLTYGLRDAPDKYALGWIQFYRQESGNTRRYYDRQFVINTRQIFVCQEANVDAGYVLHILPNYQVSAILGWSNKKE